MSLRLRPGHRVFVFSKYVDMRAGFERLSFWIREDMKQNLLEGDLFVFVGKSRRLLKALCFDGTGLLLVAKRLNQGTFMKLETLEDFVISIPGSQLVFTPGTSQKLTSYIARNCGGTHCRVHGGVQTHLIPLFHLGRTARLWESYP